MCWTLERRRGQHITFSKAIMVDGSSHLTKQTADRGDAMDAYGCEKGWGGAVRAICLSAFNLSHEKWTK